VLDVGCGIGRNLGHLEGRGVGVDHNPTSVAEARRRGHEAWTPDEFAARPGAFDSMLVAHVLEHVTAADGDNLLAGYLPYVRSGGRVVLITPQQRGFASDPTHVRWVDLDELTRTARRLGLTTRRRYSFPLPRVAGRVFTYNEFVLVATV
jgi:SAM-dependent methyltransferase